MRPRLVSPAEALDRSRQAASRWLERHGVGELGEPAGERLRDLFNPWVSHDRVVPGPFFASLEDRESTIAALRRVDPGFDASLIVRADRALAGRFDLLGFRDLSLGKPIDWHLDPTTGVRAPDRHWSEIDYLDPRVVGDHKVVWESGRHQSLLLLAQAWFCTGESRYADACAALIAGFLDANPPKRGVHWASSLELAFRCITWTWVLALIGERLPQELRIRSLAHLAISARHVERHLSRWFSPNTHLTGEALGLFVLGVALPQLRDAARWRRIGSGILLEWLGRHVRDDGTYVEQSTWYHRYTTDFYLHFLVLAERAAMQVRSAAAKAITGLLESLAWLTRPDGTMPLIGDDDGGRLLFLDEGTAHHTRSPLAIGAALLGRGDFAAVAGAPTTELVWLLGPDGLRQFDALEPRPPEVLSRAFPSGGLYVIRSGWDAAASVMAVDAGPHGFMNGGHAHADALSIDLSLRGQPVFVDPGTLTYTRSQEARDRFRSTASHSAATVDGRDSAEPAGPFQWASKTDAHGEAWHDNGAVALFAGSHAGFWKPRRIRYIRYVAFIRPDLWLVRDEVHGTGDVELAVHWQCAPGIEAIADGEQVRLALRHGLVELGVAEPGGTWSLTAGSVSPTYGALSEAPHLKYSVRRTAPFAVTTVIGDGVMARATSTGETDSGLRGARITWGDRQGWLVTARSSRPDWIETDAVIAWVESASGSRQPGVTAATVSHLTIAGTKLVGGGAVLPGFSSELQSSPIET